MRTQNEKILLQTPTGLMQTHVYRPALVGHFPVVIFYSEIFQITPPIARSANILASMGFVVLVPEIFHELNPVGTVLAYDDAGKEKGNSDKWHKSLENHDQDTEALVAWCDAQPQLRTENGLTQIGAMGVCIGGHLAFRAALNPRIMSAFCLYPTDIHSDTLPRKEGNDSLSRTKDIRGECLLVFGRQDPHVPAEGRAKLYAHFQSAGLVYQWHEVNAEHAFMRDEGERYDAVLALDMYLKAQSFFSRTLNHGKLQG